MINEVKKWMDRAFRDIDSARYNLDGKRYDVAAFLSQQAAEKALKALYIHKFKELWKIHDLAKLGDRLSAPEDIMTLCEKLNQHYIATRYPIETEYSHKDVAEAIEDSKRVIEWVKQKLAR